MLGAEPLEVSDMNLNALTISELDLSVFDSKTLKIINDLIEKELICEKGEAKNFAKDHSLNRYQAKINAIRGAIAKIKKGKRGRE